jgi:hypothetical protein
LAQKIVGFALADMARLPPSIIPTKNVLANNLVCQLGQHQLCNCLALQRKSPAFYWHILLLVLRFLWLLHTTSCNKGIQQTCAQFFSALVVLLSRKIIHGTKPVNGKMVEKSFLFIASQFFQ